MASTPSLEYLNSMWQYLPQGHEKPLKQAFYNTIANICLLGAASVVVAVYFILSPFLRPLCWAVLCGTFLYPFKRSLTAVLRHWLIGLHSSGTPLVFGCVILPFQMAYSTAEILTDGIWTNLKLLLGVIFGLPSIYLLYTFGPLQFILEMIVSTFQFLDNFTGYFSTFWIWTVFVAYVAAVIFLWSPESQKWLKILSIPMWISLVLHVSSAAGPLRVPLLILLFLLMIVGFFMEMSKKTEAMKGDPGSPGTPLFMTLFSSILGGGSEKEEEVKKSVDDTQEAQGDKAQLSTSTVEGQTPVITKPTNLDLGKKSTDTPLTHKEKSDEKKGTKEKVSPQANKESALSSQYFMALIWGHVIVRMWMHFWIIILLFLIPVFHMGLKWLWKHFCSEGKLQEKLISRNIPQWLGARKDAFIPRSVRGLGHLALKGDSKVVSVLEQGLDNTTSVLFILMLLVGTLLFSFVAAIQIQRESMYMIKSTQEILNKTMNSEVSQWMPDAEVLRNTMDQVVETTHQYGRNFISSKVKEYVQTNEADQDNLVNQVLEVWDRVYDAWFIKEDAKAVTDKSSKPFVPVYGDFSALWQMVSKGGDLFQFGSIIAFVKENLGTFMSVLDSVWVVLKGNMSLVLTVVTTVFSALLGGGSAILNFVISAVIFLTTLFYLLASSGDVYKPMELFSKMSPETGSGGSGFGQAVETAISGVFMASLKMASFYGLYTWLIHLIFGMNIVFIPSALAALFAAIPFLGPYWAAFPAVIELWLIHGQGLNAILLFVAHMLPAYVVDTAIYREIEGGHPYVTGLAIAGGIYCMGLEGALIGPMILCCLIVLVNMYGKMLKNDPQTPSTVKSQFRLHPLVTPSDRIGRWAKAPRSVSSDTVYIH